MKSRRFASGLFAAAALAAAGANAAAPRLWVEATVEPAEVPVDAQATYVLRFGHAVDVRAPRLEPPRPRLAEVEPLGPERVYETRRAGARYRVVERHFAILPFASGRLELAASVRGETPAVLPEFGGRAVFPLAAPLVALAVRPAADALPARRVELRAEGSPPQPFRVGDTWSRTILIEAEGVDGGAISPPRWASGGDWTLSADPPAVGRRIDGGRLVGFRRQVVHWTARRAGALTVGAVEVPWRSPGSGIRMARLDAVAVEVGPAPAGPAVASPAADSAFSLPGTAAVLAALAAVAAASALGRRPAVLWWRRRAARRALAIACRKGDPVAARRALLDSAALAGDPASSLGAYAAQLAGCGRVPQARAVGALEAACYGRPESAWNGEALWRAFRRPTGRPSRRRRIAAAPLVAENRA